MDNVLLGKTVKAMYKLSGKTVSELSEETGLTLDTINNLFYARLQKPGFFGVSAFVKAAGFTIADLCGFMETYEKAPVDDVTGALSKYMLSADTAKETVSSASALQKTHDSETCVSCRKESLREMERLNQTHLHYTENLAESCTKEIARMEESSRKLKEHYDHSIGEVKKAHERELAYRDKEILRFARLSAALGAALLLALVFLFLK